MSDAGFVQVDHCGWCSKEQRSTFPADPGEWIMPIGWYRLMPLGKAFCSRPCVAAWVLRWFVGVGS